MLGLAEDVHREPMVVGARSLSADASSVEEPVRFGEPLHLLAAIITVLGIAVAVFILLPILVATHELRHKGRV
jgi:hypothetical protein